MEKERGEYHHKNGWFFKRLDDGLVRVRVATSAGDMFHFIPAPEWASIVAHLATGDEAKAFATVDELHRSRAD